MCHAKPLNFLSASLLGWYTSGGRRGTETRRKSMRTIENVMRVMNEALFLFNCNAWDLEELIQKVTPLELQSEGAVAPREVDGPIYTCL